MMTQIQEIEVNDDSHNLWIVKRPSKEEDYLAVTEIKKEDHKKFEFQNKLYYYQTSSWVFHSCLIENFEFIPKLQNLLLVSFKQWDIHSATIRKGVQTYIDELVKGKTSFEKSIRYGMILRLLLESICINHRLLTTTVIEHNEKIEFSLVRLLRGGSK